MPVEAVQLNEIGQIALTVSDLARSQQFYEKTLGMKLLFNAGTMAFFQCGSVRLMLGPPEPGKAVHPSQTILYFKAPWGLQMEAISYPNGMAYEKESAVKLWSPRDPAK